MQNAPIKTVDVTLVTLAKKMLQKTNQIHVTAAVIAARMETHLVTAIVIVNVAKIANVLQNVLAHVTAKNVPVK